MPKGKCVFNTSLMNEEYKLWLKPGKTVHHGKCTLCQKEFSVSWGFKSAVNSHKCSESHKLKVKDLEEASKGLAPLYFRPPTATSSNTSSTAAATATTSLSTPSASATATSSASAASSTSTSPVSSSSSTAIDQLLAQQIATTRAEIIWVLRMVKNHDSFRSCLGLTDDLKNMFDNGNRGVVGNFSLSKTKAAYFVKYGISPWVNGKLTKQITSSLFFSVSFDESLNKKLQKNQMDLQIRFWSDELNKAVTRYWGSQFQLNTDAVTLKENLLKSLNPLPIEKQTQLAMDGPNTNWKILRLISEFRDEEEYPPLDNIGACGLHVISGALHTGVVKAGWPIENLLRAMFKFLQHSTSRRAEYLRVSNGLWPEKFVVTRWVENEPVANRAIEIWVDYVKLIKVFLGKCPSSQPKDNKSYDKLKEYHSNPLIMVYLHLFRDVAARLNNFLVKFQTDSPMIPFLSDEICSILRWLMSFFIQSEVLRKAKSAYLLSKVDVNESSGNWRLKNDMKLTISGAVALKKVRSDLHPGLKNSWVKLLEAMVLKIQERSPISFKLIRVSCALDPVRMASDPECVQTLFDAIVAIMYQNKRLNAKQSEAAKEQFSDFLRKIVKVNKNEFLAFDCKVTRVDEFLGFYVTSNVYTEFWLVCKFIFTLSHGQSAVERGFNINNETMVDNLKEMSLTSLRSVYDEIVQHGSIKSFPIDNSLLISCKSASAKYFKDLDEKRNNDKDEAKTLKRKQVSDDLAVVKKKKFDTDKLASELDKDADKLLSKANESEDLQEMKKLVAEADSFKKLSKEKKKLVDEYCTTIEKMEGELSSLNKSHKK